MQNYLLVRVHGLIQHVLRMEDYMHIVKEGVSPSILRYYQGIGGQPYDEQINTIIKTYVDRITFLAKIYPPYARFFRAFLDRLELENLKVKLRTFKSEQPTERYYSYFHHASFSRLEEIREEKDFWLLLAETPYWPEDMGIDLEDLCLETKEALLDSIYYEYLRKAAIDVGVQRKIMRLIDIEALISMLYWVIVLGEERVRELLEGKVLEGLKPKQLKISSVDPYSLSTLIGIDASELKMLIDHRNISMIKLNSYKSYLESVKKIAKMSQLSFVYVFYYMVLCRNEMENLLKILIGKKLKLAPDAILAALVLADP